MPITISTPITIPARAALSCDKIAVNRLMIYRGIDLTFSASAEIVFYAEGEQGEPIFALDDKGIIKTETMMIPDLYATAATNPTLATAITAILAAVGEMYAAKVAAETPTP
jgi:hypothetical protein